MQLLAFATIGVVATVATLSSPTATAAEDVSGSTITICSFDASRSAPLSARTGVNSYARLTDALTDPANFGPGGVDERSVSIRPGVATLTAASLEGCDVFFSSKLTSSLSSDEAAALRHAFDTARLVLIVDADTGLGEPSNSMIGAIGRPQGFGTNGSAGPNSPTGGTIALDAPASVADGPFGQLRGASFATSTSLTVTKFGKLVGTTDGAKVRKSRGRVMTGGDPSAVDLFTSPTSSYYNPNNLIMYLNFISSTP